MVLEKVRLLLAYLDLPNQLRAIFEFVVMILKKTWCNANGNLDIVHNLTHYSLSLLLEIIYGFTGI